MYLDIRWIRCAASLAYHGLFGDVMRLEMEDVNLSPVPTMHLASLTSSVTLGLSIKNVSGCDFLSILTSLGCTDVAIINQGLGREETQALVQVMEKKGSWWIGFEILNLGDNVTLDIETLVEYSGQGRCKEITLSNETLVRYSEELRTWARSRNWEENLLCEELAPSLESYQTVFKRLD